MKLSFQMVCIIFGVTLVHLVIIATLSPVGIEGETFLGPGPELVLEGNPTGEAVPSPVPDAEGSREVPAVLPLREAFPSEPIDPPARRREEAAVPVTSDPDPVAVSRPVPQSPRS
jgi:hypothetical protein